MIIACIDNLNEKEFVKRHPDKAIIAKDLPLDEYIENIKKLDDKYDYVFTSAPSANIFEKENIRYFAAVKKSTSSQAKNLIRFDENETFVDKFKYFEDR